MSKDTNNKKKNSRTGNTCRKAEEKGEEKNSGKYNV